MAMKINTKSPNPFIGRGNCWFELGLFEKSQDDYSKAIELSSNNDLEICSGAYSNRGGVKIKIGLKKEAIEDLNKAIELFPTNPNAYSNRGIVKKGMGLNKKAIEDFNKAIELYPEFLNAYINRGQTKKKIGLNKEAIDDFNKAIELSPNNAELYLYRGETKMKLGLNLVNGDEKIVFNLLKDAEKDCMLALKFDTGGIKYASILKPIMRNDILNHLGFIRINLFSFKEAIEDFNKSLEIKRCPIPLANRGFAKYKLSMVEEAMKDYQEAIEIDPKYYYTYYYLGLKKKDEKRYKEAISFFEKSILLSPGWREPIKEIEICSKLSSS